MEPSKKTLAVFLDEWLAAVESQLRVSTWDSYGDLIRVQIKPRIGHVKLVALTPPMLNALYADLLRNGRSDGKGGLAPRTVRYVHTVLSKALSDAVKWRYLQSNVAKFADPPKPARPVTETWDGDQLGTFLRHVSNERLFACFVLLATTAMRRGEVAGLKWADVDLDTGRIQIQQTRVSVKHAVHVSSPKTARSRRSIGLDTQTLEVLKAHRVRQLEERLQLGAIYTDEDWVFACEDGRGVHPGSITNTFNRLCRRTGLPRIRLHDLRHSWATVALEKGVHPKVVSDRLGHASIAITLDTYSHVLEPVDQEAADRVAGAIFGEHQAGGS